jgi:hypothetical protein
MGYLQSIRDEYDAKGNYIGNSEEGNRFHGIETKEMKKKAVQDKVLNELFACSFPFFKEAGVAIGEPLETGGPKLVKFINNKFPEANLTVYCTLENLIKWFRKLGRPV